MKKLLNILAITLALNFIAAAGGIAYLFQSGALNREKITAIKAMLGPATTQAVVEEKKDQPDSTTQPTIKKLDELLAQVSGRPAGEQVEFLQRKFDGQMAQLDRRQQEVLALMDQVARDRDAQDKRQKALDLLEKKLKDRDKALTRDVQDKGFADSMALYESMSAKQVKESLAAMDDATATRYLRAMEPARAAKILKEFKTPAESERVQKMMQLIRGTQAEANGS